MVDGVPRTLNLVELLQAYIDHQIVVIRRRSEYRLAKAQDEAHITEGLIKALERIDDVIDLIRSSADRSEARTGLMNDEYGFTEIQANHILDMQLVRLTRLGKSTLEERMQELSKIISDLESILSQEAKIKAVIKEEILELKEKFSSERKTEFVPDPGELDIEDLIDDEELIFAMTSAGYVKTMALLISTLRGVAAKR